MKTRRITNNSSFKLTTLNINNLGGGYEVDKRNGTIIADERENRSAGFYSYQIWNLSQT